MVVPFLSIPPTISKRPGFSPHAHNKSAFTLIELSIVLVIIGLIVGGVLVGRDLVAAAHTRATITQVSQFSQAYNVFRDKYSALPGDIIATEASKFGLDSSAPGFAGWGNGDGMIQGSSAWGWDGYAGSIATSGETAVFWKHLYQAKLIKEPFASVNFSEGFYPTVSDPSKRWPAAVLGRNNYFYVYTGWPGSADPNPYSSYFGLSSTSALNTYTSWSNTTPGLTVKEAQAIDAKLDDGLPQSGKVLAIYWSSGTYWAAGGGLQGANNSQLATTSATSGSSTTCYDNNGVNGAQQQYSLNQNNGTGVNCALSFKF